MRGTEQSAVSKVSVKVREITTIFNGNSCLFNSRDLITRLFSKREFGSRQGRMSSSFKETMDPAVAQSALLRAYAEANGEQQQQHGSRHGESSMSLPIRSAQISVP